MRVVAMAEPGNEDGLVVPLPAHRGLPQIVEQAADTVGRALQDDFRADGTRHRLPGAGRVLHGLGPVRSEERRVVKECVSTRNSRESSNQYKKKRITNRNTDNLMLYK